MTPAAVEHKPTYDNSATVSADLKWIPITPAAPFGTKCQVIDETQRIAYMRVLWPNHGWTHYFPLPTF